MEGYGGDHKFAQVVNAAKIDGDQVTRDAALQLEIKYFIGLLTTKVSYDDLFTRLKLNNGQDKDEAVSDGRIKLLDEYIQF
ncbi:hypothetical protein PsorP6_002845 [Peronosclerospora sorghi]|uniref:Uncharacterized protein n=1 Tax=Peronosclerospora sorghi TaxID=230839 RepID=A0ACC0VLV3_9STRA|nr:hypothetical protein PsorP6_002845 [Peronosclerospora sorghi]